jgi:chromate transporter
MKKIKALLTIFLTFFKIGLFTFGGCYAIVAVIEREIVEKKKWIEHDEYIDVVAIAESTPGPIAINSATYIGYKVGGFIGALFATLGVVLPSFAIIVLISIFYEQFIKIALVKHAFHGIQACVAYLILSAGLKMFKKLKKTVLNVVLFSLTLLGIVAFTLFFPQVKISSILYILIGGVVGVVVYLITYMAQKGKEKKQNQLNNADKEGDEQ